MEFTVRKTEAIQYSFRGTADQRPGPSTQLEDVKIYLEAITHRHSTI